MMTAASVLKPLTTATALLAVAAEANLVELTFADLEATVQILGPGNVVVDLENYIEKSWTDQYADLGVVASLLDYPNQGPTIQDWPFVNIYAGSDPRSSEGVPSKTFVPYTYDCSCFATAVFKFHPKIDYFNVLALDAEESFTISAHSQGTQLPAGFCGRDPIGTSAVHGGTGAVIDITCGQIGGATVFDEIRIGGADIPELWDFFRFNQVEGTGGDGGDCTDEELEDCLLQSGACNDALAECQGAEETCSTDLVTCGDDLSDCQDTSSSLQGSLDQCESDLASCNDDLTSCTNTAGGCANDLDQCANVDLPACQDERDACDDSLTSCSSDLDSCLAQIESLEEDNAALVQQTQDLEGRVALVIDLYVQETGLTVEQCGTIEERVDNMNGPNVPPPFAQQLAACDVLYDDY